jgi:hypothetical protein
MKKARLLIGLGAILLLTKPGVTGTLNTLSHKMENHQSSAASQTTIEVHQGEQEGGGALW